MPSPTPSSSTTPRDAYLRISIANVKTEQLALLPARLVLLSELWEEKGAGWGLGEGS